MDIPKNLAVETYCFRNFSNAEVVEMTKTCGLQSVEIAAFGVHADISKPEAFEEVISTYRNAGVNLCSAFCEEFTDNAEKGRRNMAFAKAAGIRILTCDFDIQTMPECFKTAEALAEEYDVRLAIHNHGASHWLGGSQVLEWVFGRTSDRIGLCLDTAWALDARQDPVAMAEKFSSRLFTVHLKDFVFDRSGAGEDVIIGEGNLDLKALLGTLKKIDFEGPATIEYEGDADDPVPATRRCVEAVLQYA